VKKKEANFVVVVVVVLAFLRLLIVIVIITISSFENLLFCEIVCEIVKIKHLANFSSVLHRRLLSMMMMKFSIFSYCIFLILICISFHDVHHCQQNYDRCGCRLHHVPLSTTTFSFSHSCSFSMIVDAVTNANDTIAMLAFRQSFNNFTASDWYSNDDPCSREFQIESRIVKSFSLSLSLSLSLTSSFLSPKLHQLGMD
jgi:hypothetical protein